MDILQLISVLAYFLAFIAYALLIGFVLYKDPKALPNRLCALALASFAVWNLGYAFCHSADSASNAMLWMNVTSLGWCSYPISLFWFYLAVTRNDRLLRNRIFIILCLLVAAFFIYLQWAGYLIIDVIREPYGWSIVWADLPPTFLFAIYYILLSCACIYLAYKFGQKTRRPYEKKQARLLYITPTIALILGSMTDVIFPVLKISFVPPVACIIILIWGGGLVYAITRYGLMTLTPVNAAENILNTMTDSLMLVDMDGRITTVNKAALNLLGYTAEELVNKEFSSIVTVKATDGDALLRETFQQGKISSRDVTYLTRTGGNIPVLLSASVVKDKEGEPMGVVVTASDITERKQAEERLKESDERYSLLFQSAPDLIAQVSREGRFIALNPAMAKSLGFSFAEALIDKTLFEVIPQDVAQHRLEIIEKVLNEGQFYTFEDEREGNYRHNLFVPIKIPGQEETVLVIARDITDYKKMELNLRQSEEKYRTLVELALVGIAIHQKGRFIFANKRLADMLGYTLEEFIGLTIAERIHPDERDLILTRARRRLAGYDEPVTYEIRLLKKDGSLLYALISNAVMDYNGQPATLITIADTTDTKTRIELEQANRELEAFSYSVSHDLRAPLRSIAGFSRILLEDYEDSLDNKGRGYLSRMCAASQRMSQLIDDLLNLSRITRSEMRYKTVNLSVEAASIVAALQETAKDRQVEFIIGEEITAYGDRSLLRVVLENLLGNAWKFTSKHPRARIEFGTTQQGGRTIYFVRDDGAGFDMTYVDKIFAPFQRLHGSNEFEGTGIGLATVQRIIYRHGGSVWAEGEAEKGATFYFTLKS